MRRAREFVVVVRENLGTVVLLILFGSSLALNVILGVALVPRRPEPLVNPVGVVLPPVDAEAADGTQIRLQFADQDRETVLYHLSPTCVICDRNYDNIRALAEQRLSTFRFVGISSFGSDLVGLQAHLKEKPLPFPVFHVTDQQWLDGIPLLSTPLTLVVNRNGRVTEYWRGAFASVTGPRIARYFGVVLPGTAPPR